jgi:transcriptional regulator with XRE-family HTH domain
MMRKTQPKLNKVVAEAMKARNLTDQKLADAAKCDRTWVTRIRRGMKLRTLSTPIRIARILDIPIESLADTDAA